METIKPEKDEVDAFRSQKTGGKAQAFRAQAKSTGPVALPSETVAAPDNVLRMTRPAQWMIILMFLLLVAMTVLFAWQVQNHEGTIVIMEEQLIKAQRNIDQSQLVVARLEGQIFQTDATMAQSGNELAREIKRMDLEQRRQAKQLEGFTAQIDKRLQASAEETTSRLEDVGAAVARLTVVEEELSGLRKIIEAAEVQLRNLAVRLEEQESIAGKTDARVMELAQSVEAGRAADEESGAAIEALRLEGRLRLARLDELEAAVAKADKGAQGSASAKSVQDITQRVEAIDATRGQLVQRFVNLDRKLNELSLEVQALRVTRPEQP
jgi:chromosome segregation ATPase